ncbi:MAG TPA: glutaredoxin domain-containing protein [Candidatus Omnitrophota bacterium]|nr:glutaredoxin domain-containing protein [Candidatus Omnitrophota bacterium]HPS20340.1 glutaredoxin domain-containing protein [Candidatus Omnitrophota bacterium]
MAKTVKVYSTVTCPFCVRVKQYLKDNNIAFEEIDVAKDPLKAQEIFQRSGQIGVPVIDVDGEIVVGFDKINIARLLGL